MFLFLKVTETLFWEAWKFWGIFWPLYKHKVHLKGLGARWSAQEPCVCLFVFLPPLPFWVCSSDFWHFFTACLFDCLFFGHLWHFEQVLGPHQRHLLVLQKSGDGEEIVLDKKWQVLTTMQQFDKMNTCSHLDKINNWKLYVHFLQLAKKAKTKRFVPERWYYHQLFFFTFVPQF